MIKIAISGQVRTGKNTLAEMLVDSLAKESYKIVALADPIKRIVLEMIPDADPECLFGESKLRSHVLPGDLRDEYDLPLTYRKILTDIGKLGRSYHSDLWLNALVKHAENNEHLSAYIVSDARFPNELKHLKAHGFHMVRITRKDAPKHDDISETAQLDVPDSFFHQVIQNDQDLDTLREFARSIRRELS